MDFQVTVMEASQTFTISTSRLQTWQALPVKKLDLLPPEIPLEGKRKTNLIARDKIHMVLLKMTILRRSKVKSWIRLTKQEALNLQRNKAI